MDHFDDVVRYKKRSKSKPPKKADHKHRYEPCVLEYNFPYGGDLRVRGFEPVRRCRIDGYCPVCGKVGAVSMERWYDSPGWGYKQTLSDDAKRELDPSTRTLPTFDVGDDWVFPEFVQLK